MSRQVKKTLTKIMALVMVVLLTTGAVSVMGMDTGEYQYNDSNIYIATETETGDENAAETPDDGSDNSYYTGDDTAYGDNYADADYGNDNEIDSEYDDTDYGDTDYENEDYDYTEEDEYDEDEEDDEYGLYGLLVPVPLYNGIVAATQHTVSNFAGLQQLIADDIIQDGDTILLTAAVTIPTGQSLDLDFGGINVTLLVGGAFRHFIVHGTLTLEESITLQGHRPQNSENELWPSGGGVFVSNGGFFTMNGGTITGNNAMLGGGVFVGSQNSHFIMNGGAINYNRATQRGGGVTIDIDASFNFNSGTISHNHAMQNGGGLQIANGASLHMTAGIIEWNTTDLSGGGIDFIRSTGDIIGGIIRYNRTTLPHSHAHSGWTLGSGGGVIIDDSTVNISQPNPVNPVLIYGNEATIGGGIHIATLSYFTMTGGIVQYNSAYVAGGGIFNLLPREFTLLSPTLVTNNTVTNPITIINETTTFTNFTLGDNLTIRERNNRPDAPILLVIDAAVTPDDGIGRLEAAHEIFLRADDGRIVFRVAGIGLPASIVVDGVHFVTAAMNSVVTLYGSGGISSVDVNLSSPSNIITTHMGSVVAYENDGEVVVTLPTGYVTMTNGDVWPSTGEKLAYPTGTHYFVVMFNSNGGSFVPSTLSELNELLAEPIPTKDGHVFLGWYRDVALTDRWDFDIDTVDTLFGLHARWEPLNFELEVIVRDESGNPITNAEVVIRDDNGDIIFTGNTDGNGSVSIFVPDGEYEITASHPDFNDVPPVDVIVDGDDETVIITLPQDRELEVIVRDENGNSIPGANVVIRDDNNDIIFTGTTDGNGRVVVTVPDGEYTITASHPDFNNVPPVNVIVDGDDETVIITLPQDNSGGNDNGGNDNGGNDNGGNNGGGTPTPPPLRKDPDSRYVYIGDHINWNLRNIRNYTGETVANFSIIDIPSRGLNFVLGNLPAFTNGAGITFDIRYTVAGSSEWRTYATGVDASQPFSFSLPQPGNIHYTNIGFFFGTVPADFARDNEIVLTFLVTDESPTNVLVNRFLLRYDSVERQGSGSVIIIRPGDTPATGGGNGGDGSGNQLPGYNTQTPGQPGDMNLPPVTQDVADVQQQAVYEQAQTPIVYGYAEESATDTTADTTGTTGTVTERTNPQTSDNFNPTGIILSMLGILASLLLVGKSRRKNAA